MTKLRRKLADRWLDAQAEDVFTSEGGRTQPPPSSSRDAPALARTPEPVTQTKSKRGTQPCGNVRYRT